MTTLDRLRDEAATCTRCPLYERATQTVFGEGLLTKDLTNVAERLRRVR